jgi:hypothetical protein
MKKFSLKNIHKKHVEGQKIIRLTVRAKLIKKRITVKKTGVINYGLTLVNEERLIGRMSEKTERLKSKAVLLSSGLY